MSDLKEFADEAHRLQLTHYTHVAQYMEAKAAAEAATAQAGLVKANWEVKTAELMHLRMQNANRPSVVLQVKIETQWVADEKTYIASYAGVTAHGDTPEIAFQNFDRVWSQGRE